MSFQQTTILGNVGQQARVGTNKGQCVINFSVAVNKKWTDGAGQKQERTTWFDCEYWPKSAGVADYLTCGKQVLVTGEVRAETFTYKDKTTGVALRLRVDTLTLADSGGAKPTEQPADPAPPFRGEPTATAPAARAKPHDPDNDLPF